MPQDPAPTLLVDYPAECGEGPLWHEETQTIHWVDIEKGDLFQFDPANETNKKLYSVAGRLGGYTIQRDGSLILFGDDGRITRLTGDSEDIVIESIPAMHGSRFNDVIADPMGRIFCGTMPLGADGSNPGHIYRLDPDGTLKLVYDDIALANGMGFSPDLTTMYLTDSNSRCIYRADYDRSTGQLQNREVIVQLEGTIAVPDGMSVDANGNIWSALWDGRQLVCYSPTGKELASIAFSVRKVSSITFGGPDFGTAYVTTAGGQLRGPEEGVYAGSLFQVNLGVSGKAPFRSRLGE